MSENEVGDDIQNDIQDDILERLVQISKRSNVKRLVRVRNRNKREGTYLLRPFLVAFSQSVVLTGRFRRRVMDILNKEKN